MAEFLSFAGIFLFLIISYTLIFKFGKKEEIKRKKKENVISCVIISKIYSLNEISKVTGLSLFEVETLLKEIIKTSSLGNNKINKLMNIGAFKNAMINHASGEIVLDPHANDTMFTRMGAAANSVLDRFAPKPNNEAVAFQTEKPQDWNCEYCNSLNPAELIKCSQCGAKK